MLCILDNGSFYGGIPSLLGGDLVAHEAESPPASVQVAEIPSLPQELDHCPGPLTKLAHPEAIPLDKQH